MPKINEEIYGKEIPGFEGCYSITKDGRVFGLKRQSWRKTRLDKYGYVTIRLVKDNQYYDFLIHRLVMMTYNPIENMDSFQVNHKYGDKLDNFVDNLEWMTLQQNHEHAYKVLDCCKSRREKGWFSEETRNLISQNSKGNKSRTGKPHSEETKKLMSLHNGMKNPEYKQKHKEIMASKEVRTHMKEAAKRRVI